MAEIVGGQVTSWDEMITAINTAEPEQPGDEYVLEHLRFLIEQRARRLTRAGALH